MRHASALSSGSSLPSATALLLGDFPDRMAERQPDHEAFRWGTTSLTYSALALKTSQLAQMLLALGVRKGDRVGLYLEKSLETAIGLYGILKAGAAYVPLDPAAPRHRLEYMIRHCGVKVLISAPSRGAMLRELGTLGGALAAVIGLEQPLEGLRSCSWTEVFQQSGVRPPLHLTQQDIAYIMFTSGSTGMPKGMVHTHGSGLAYALASRDLYAVGPEDRLGNHSPLHFDMSTFEFLTGPLAGAATIIIPEAYTRLPASLSLLMEKERLTFWYSVPFALIQLLLRGVLEKRDLRTLRWVMFGGEPFPPKYLHALMKQWPKARFSNVYGPAEINQCTYFHLPGPPEDLDASVPIGQIWDAAEGLILDDSGAILAGTGFGELVVRGPSLMQGYFNRPELNARAFVHLPGIEGHFYRTGDLVSRDPEGRLHFLGRKDRLVKIRGYRVELDEIELSLTAQPAVEEAAVFVNAREPEAPELEAAVLLKPGASVSEQALLDSVSARMPPYGVPRRIHVLESFPRTTSGKIDRRALQATLCP